MTCADRDFAPLVLRPKKLGHMGAGELMSAGGWLLASVAFLFRFRGTALLILGSLDFAVVLAIVVFAVAVRPRIELRLDAGKLIRRGVRGSRLLFTKGDLGRVVELDVEVGGHVMSSRLKLWLLVRADGTTAAKLNRKIWDRDELETMREKLGLPLETVDAVQPARVARCRYPGALSWWVVHPAVTSWMIFACVIAAAIATKTP
jgi:hypothetical protein